MEGLSDGINYFAKAFKELEFIDGFGEDHANKLSAACKEQVKFNSCYVLGFGSIQTERIFEKINTSFNKNPVLVKVVPMVCVAFNAGIKSEILIGIGVNTSAVF